ncbi:MAG TPA: hypothetical protein DEV93_00525 [Chloroflexi bacterium]|jgi:hypothetical protein|nr:hypothetical protein [Chloroflexota bacterium]
MAYWERRWAALAADAFTHFVVAATLETGFDMKQILADDAITSQFWIALQPPKEPLRDACAELTYVTYQLLVCQPIPNAMGNISVTYQVFTGLIEDTRLALEPPDWYADLFVDVAWGGCPFERFSESVCGKVTAHRTGEPRVH